MKRLLIINEVCGHTSTGKICGEIAEKWLKLDGWKVKIAFWTTVSVSVET